MILMCIIIVVSYKIELYYNHCDNVKLFYKLMYVLETSLLKILILYCINKKIYCEKIIEMDSV